MAVCSSRLCDSSRASRQTHCRRRMADQRSSRPTMEGVPPTHASDPSRLAGISGRRARMGVRQVVAGLRTAPPPSHASWTCWPVSQLRVRPCKALHMPGMRTAVQQGLTHRSCRHARDVHSARRLRLGRTCVRQSSGSLGSFSNDREIPTPASVHDPGASQGGNALANPVLERLRGDNPLTVRRRGHTSRRSEHAHLGARRSRNGASVGPERGSIFSN